MTTANRSSLMNRYLDPASSLGEIMFGLIMTLTFTLGAGIIIEDEGAEGARDLLIALVGCNIAWGVIDAAMYLMTELFTRGKRRRVAHAVRSAPDERGGVAVVEKELGELLEDVGDDAERQALYARVAAKVRTAEIKPNRLTGADFMGAFTSFWLVVIASLPAAIPFLIWDDARFALRVSNGILLAFLFFCGYNWARYTLGNPWTAGLIFLATLINFINRLTISVLAPVITEQLKLTNLEFASITNSFLLAYTASQALSGKLYDRVGNRRGFSISIIVWSLASMLHAFATGLFSLNCYRFLLGLGEAGNWPGAAKVIAEWFPIRQRALGMAIFNSGTSIGSVVAPPLIIALQATRLLSPTMPSNTVLAGATCSHLA